MKFLKTFSAVAFILMLFSCAHKVTRIESNETPDISGKWNNTDSRLTADDMISQSLNTPWLANFSESKKEKSQ